LKPKEGETPTGRRRGPRALVVRATAAAAIAALVYHVFFSDHFGVVDPEWGVYRCAQPESHVGRLIDRYHLATILNLRGGSILDDWYVEECSEAARRGVAFYDIPLSATHRPSRCELLGLIDLLGDCKLPLLIHCRSGSDRTGLVSGLYLMVRRGEPPERAERALSFVYGHVPLFGTQRLHEPFVEYASWLNAQGQGHTVARLRRWAAEVYRADARDTYDDCPPVRSGPRPVTRPAGG
jgi:protein tyrosine/serine phosphatase